MTLESTEFSDETLTGFLDGELDAQTTAAIDAALVSDEVLADRLAALDFPMDALRAVMAPNVLGAPTMPAGLLDAPTVQEVRVAPRRQKVFMPLALVASFLVGMVATTLLIPATPAPSPAPLGWTATVASYQSLYVTETLSDSVQDPAATESVLARAADEFDVALGPATQIDGIDFRRAQMLGFRGKPLLQIAYLTPEGTPMALCLIRTDKPDRGTKQVEMFDMAGVSWVKDGVGYFLIGGDDAAQIEDLSARMVAAL